MNNLIKAIMEAKHLTPSRFADEIGVPRPVVSHVLAGRNRPSLDMVQKIARRFPELGTDWILDETVLPNGVYEIRDDIRPPVAEPKAAPPPAPTYAAPAMPPPAQAPAPVMPTMGFLPAGKRIEKILVFYTDRTFDEYTPNH